MTTVPTGNHQRNQQQHHNQHQRNPGGHYYHGREATIQEEQHSISSYAMSQSQASVASEYTPTDRYLDVANSQREDYPEVEDSSSQKSQDKKKIDDTDKQHQQLQPETSPTWDTTTAAGASQDSTDDTDTDDDDATIDLEFVENFDSAFNEFIAINPKFLMNNPDLVHSLRVTKLQKLLEFQDAHESDLLEQLELAKSFKTNMELEYQQKLRHASGKKAAREINLQSDLDRLNLSTKVMEAKLMWELVTLSETRAKKQFSLTQKYRKLTIADTRQAWSDQVPTGPDGQAVRDAILAPPAGGTGALSPEQEKDLRQFQVDNAFMSSELTVMRKKLEYLKGSAKKHAWVQSVLLRVNAETMEKLKARYQKKTGAMF